MLCQDWTREQLVHRQQFVCEKQPKTALMGSRTTFLVELLLRCTIKEAQQLVGLRQYRHRAVHSVKALALRPRLHLGVKLQ